jgi:flagellar motor switch protein FliM
LQMQVGNVITLNTSETAPLPVYVQGRPKMTASPRVVGGGMAIEILRAISPTSGKARAGAQNAYPHNP